MAITNLGFAEHTVYAAEGDWSLGKIEKVVVTGNRGKPRSVMNSAVSVDVFNSEAIKAVSNRDTQDILQTLIPSYNVSREPNSNGATFIRQAILRGLNSDKTLVLVNSKWRHRASMVALDLTVEHGQDVATIPASAIANVEVLCDCAAAQYGSDAIAGSEKIPTHPTFIQPRPMPLLPRNHP